MKKEEFHRKINNNLKPIVVDLWAPWCSPCKMMEPAFKAVGQKYSGQVDILKINADDSPEVLKELGVMSIPTVIGFAEGVEILRRTGMQTESMLEGFFDATYHKEKPAIMPLAPAARVFRTVLGLALMIVGWSLDRSILLMILGGVVIFSAFYDRCPIFNAVYPKIKNLFRPLKNKAPLQ